MSAAADIRRRLLAGEPVTSRQVATDYGVSTALLGTVVTELRKGGTDVVADRAGGGRGTPAMFSVPSAVKHRKQWGPAPGVKRASSGPKPKTAKARKAAKATSSAVVKRVEHAPAELPTFGNGTLEHPVPQLGANVQVFLLALTDDGSVSVGLRDGERTWLTAVNGFSAR